MIKRFALALALALLIPLPAFAAVPVELRDHPVSHGGVITLADLFDTDSTASLGRAAPPGGEAVLDAQGVQIVARAAGLEWTNPRGQHRIVVVSLGGGAGETTAPRPTRASTSKTVAVAKPRRNQALAYARNIQAGEILGAADLIWSDEAIGGDDSLGNPDLAVGKAARHALRAGAAAGARDLLAPHVIKRDEMVRVSFDAEGVSVTLDGKAMGDASIGDTVQVMNTASKRIVEAVASGPGQAVVGPRADALKAQAFQPGAGNLQTAALR